MLLPSLSSTATTLSMCIYFSEQDLGNLRQIISNSVASGNAEPKRIRSKEITLWTACQLSYPVYSDSNKSNSYPNLEVMVALSPSQSFRNNFLWKEGGRRGSSVVRKILTFSLFTTGCILLFLMSTFLHHIAWTVDPNFHPETSHIQDICLLADFTGSFRWWRDFTLSLLAPTSVYILFPHWLGLYTLAQKREA